MAEYVPPAKLACSMGTVTVSPTRPIRVAGPSAYDKLFTMIGETLPTVLSTSRPGSDDGAMLNIPGDVQFGPVRISRHDSIWITTGSAAGVRASFIVSELPHGA